MVEDAVEKGLPFINYLPSAQASVGKGVFLGASKPCSDEIQRRRHQILRGRVAWNIDKFIVLVGHWAEPILDTLTALLEKDFAFLYFAFVYDEHWDLGHSWPGDMA